MGGKVNEYRTPRGTRLRGPSMIRQMTLLVGEDLRDFYYNDAAVLERIDREEVTGALIIVHSVCDGGYGVQYGVLETTQTEHSIDNNCMLRGSDAKNIIQYLKKRDLWDAEQMEDVEQMVYFENKKQIETFNEIRDKCPGLRRILNRLETLWDEHGCPEWGDGEIILAKSIHPSLLDTEGEIENRYDKYVTQLFRLVDVNMGEDGSWVTHGFVTRKYYGKPDVKRTEEISQNWIDFRDAACVEILKAAMRVEGAERTHRDSEIWMAAMVDEMVQRNGLREPVER